MKERGWAREEANKEAAKGSQEEVAIPIGGGVAIVGKRYAIQRFADERFLQRPQTSGDLGQTAVGDVDARLAGSSAGVSPDSLSCAIQHVTDPMSQLGEIARCRSIPHILALSKMSGQLLRDSRVFANEAILGFSSLDILVARDTNMAEKSAAQTTKVRVLVLNSNSSTEMTHGIEDALRNMDLPEVRIFVLSLFSIFLPCFVFCPSIKKFNFLGFCICLVLFLCLLLCYGFHLSV